MNRRLPILIALLAALALAACTAPSTPAPQSTAALTPITIYLTYQPDVQFAPFYVGIEKGFFKEQGLDVTLQHDAESTIARLVATGDAPFAVVSGEQVLLGRASDLPLVYVYRWYQKFPVAIASEVSQGIQTPADLKGHSVGTPMQEGASYIGLEALLASANLTDADINLQVTGFSQVETLVSGRVDAVVVYSTNEPVQLAAQGVDVNLLNVSDYADLVSNGIIASEQTVAQHPELVRAVDAAFSQALQYTIDHPDEAYTISQKYVEGLSDPSVAPTQQAVLARSIDVWRAARLGLSDLSSWQAMQDVLLRMGLLSAPLDLNKVFSNDFLP